MWGEVAISIVILTGLGLLFATVIAVAYKKLRVWEDPRIEQVEEMLPGANCGACGQPGCRAFAEKVVSLDSPPGKYSRHSRRRRILDRGRRAQGAGRCEPA